MGILTIEEAKSILNDAKAGGFYESDTLPDDDDGVISTAEFYAQEAKKAVEVDSKLKRDKSVKAILNVWEQAVNRDAEEQVNDIFGAPEKDIWKGLPVPEDMHGDPSYVPTDYTEIGDKELRKLHGEYNAYLARAKWMLSITINRLSDATHLRDEAYRAAYVKKYNEAALGGEKISGATLDEIAKGDEGYKKHNTQVRQLQNDVTSYKALMEIYSKYVETLSREWTMRTEEDRRAY